MAEELAELGLTGIEKATERYHDKAYDRIPNPRKAYRARRVKGNMRSRSEPRAEENMAPYNRRGGYDREPGRSRQDYGYQGAERDTGNDYYNDTRGRANRDDDYENGAGREVAAPNESYGWEEYQQTQGYNDGAMQRYSNAPPRSSYDREGTSGRNRRHDDDDRRDRWERSPSQSRRGRRDRSQSRSKATAIGATVLGAVAGGLLGNEAGHGDILGTMAGAMAGALGANTLEHQYEKRKDARLQKLWDDGKGGKADRRRRRRSR